MPSKKKREDLPLFLSPDQAAKISGLGVNRIRQLMEDGQLGVSASRQPAADNRPGSAGLLQAGQSTGCGLKGCVTLILPSGPRRVKSRWAVVCLESKPPPTSKEE